MSGGEPRNGCVLLGVHLDAISFDEAIDRMEAFARGTVPRLVVTVNVDFLARARRDPAFRDLLNRADLRVADGMPIVWASRLAGRPLPERIPGVDLLHAFAKRAALRGLRIFLLGARPGVADGAARVLRERFPTLQVAGTHSPPPNFEQRSDEDAEAVRRVAQARPDALFLAVSTPRGERWIRRLHTDHAVPLALNVGAAFDMTVGRVPRAPGFVRRLGLEWCFRLSREPGRLWRRYIVDDMPIAVSLLLEALRARVRS